MGAPKQKWTSEEEEALKAGVSKHGAGKWRTIQKDPEFSHCLASRSNIDLKDKWRNMSLSASGLGSREKVKSPKSKSPFSSLQTSSSLPSPNNNNNNNKITVKKESQSPDSSKKYSVYCPIVLEAITALKKPDGASVEEISNYVNLKVDSPPECKKTIGVCLKRLVSKDKIEKVGKSYRLKDPSSFATKTPTPTPKHPSATHHQHRPKPLHPQHPQTTPVPAEVADRVRDEASVAAYRLAEAETKSNFAMEAVRELERVGRLEEESGALLAIALEIRERCMRGEVFTIGA
ncbi:hypothetical protein LUZ60_000352 [Juncus effusus]|nr:hypothetical protein LUZ60_000352 [Juncus effusus]